MFTRSLQGKLKKAKVDIYLFFFVFYFFLFLFFYLFIIFFAGVIFNEEKDDSKMINSSLRVIFSFFPNPENGIAHKNAELSPLVSTIRISAREFVKMYKSWFGYLKS